MQMAIQIQVTRPFSVFTAGRVAAALMSFDVTGSYLVHIFSVQPRPPRACLHSDAMQSCCPGAGDEHVRCDGVMGRTDGPERRLPGINSRRRGEGDRSKAWRRRKGRNPWPAMARVLLSEQRQSSQQARMMALMIPRRWRCSAAGRAPVSDHSCLWLREH